MSDVFVAPAAAKPIKEKKKEHQCRRSEKLF